MKKLLAGLTALVTVSATGYFGVGTASADDTPIGGPPTPGAPGDQTAFALGGAHVLGIPYDEYIRREGAEWFPGQKREIVRYPAGQVQGHVLERLFPGISKLDGLFPGLGLDGPSVGESVDAGVDNLDAAVKTGRPGTAIGLSEGGFVVDGEQARLANDPTPPPPDKLNFATFGDPIGRHAFGQSFLSAVFPVGSVVPALDYTMPALLSNPPQEQSCFGATLVDASPGTPDAPWLRTGDLGFIYEGELFIVGRIKDLLIIRGRNHYPEDVETTVQEITGGRVAAVSVPMNGTEELVAVIELKQQGDSDRDANRLARVKSDVTSAISNAHGLNVGDLVLVSPGSIPTTTSGKIRRAVCVEQYRQDQFTRLDA